MVQSVIDQIKTNGLTWHEIICAFVVAFPESDNPTVPSHLVLCCLTWLRYGQTIFGSVNGLSSGRPRTIISIKAGILLIEPVGTKFIELYSQFKHFPSRKMSSVKWRSSCLGFKLLIWTQYDLYMFSPHTKLAEAVHILNDTTRVFDFVQCVAIQDVKSLSLKLVLLYITYFIIDVFGVRWNLFCWGYICGSSGCILYIYLYQLKNKITDEFVIAPGQWSYTAVLWAKWLLPKRNNVPDMRIFAKCAWSWIRKVTTNRVTFFFGIRHTQKCCMSKHIYT